MNGPREGSATRGRRDRDPGPAISPASARRSGGDGARGEDETGSDHEAQQDSECACTPGHGVDGAKTLARAVGVIVVAVCIAVVAGRVIRGVRDGAGMTGGIAVVGVVWGRRHGIGSTSSGIVAEPTASVAPRLDGE